MFETVAQQLYVAYFGRPADFFGIRSFAAEVQRLLPQAKDIRDLANAIQNKNAGVLALVNGFGTSKESSDLYGTATSDNTANFVNSVYLNVLDRNADVPGLTFWVNEITAGNITRASFSAVLMAAAINNTQSAVDQNTVANKIAVAQAFTTALDTNAEIQAYSGNAAAAAARAILNDVDSTTPAAGFQARVENTISNLVISNAGAGNSMTLTTGVDNLVGTAGNDVIRATASDIQLADNINGGSGSDRLNITVANEDYSEINRQDGSKNIEVRAQDVETIEVTARTSLVQNRNAAGFPVDTRIDGATQGGNNLFNTGADTALDMNDQRTRDSDTVDTIVTLSQFNASTITINSVDTEVNGSALTFNDIQRIKDTVIGIQDTGSAHNFLFDVQAETNPIAGSTNDALTLRLTEARGLTINFGTTPDNTANTLPASTTFANADAPQRLGEINNDGQFTDNATNGGIDNDRDVAGFYGFAQADQSKIDAMKIESNVTGPAGIASVFRNEVLDLNIGRSIKTLDISGQAQLKVGLAFGTEQTLTTLVNSSPRDTLRTSLPDTTAPVYSYGITPALGNSGLINDPALRDFAFVSNSYSLDAAIRTINASAHFAGVNQAAGVYADLTAAGRVADLTLDLSNGSTDATDTTTFNYSGSQGEDLINFGNRAINKNILLNDGNDTVIAGRGSDTISGGNGNDVIKHNNSTTSNQTGAGVVPADAALGRGFAAGNAVTVFGGAGNDQVVIAGQTVENAISLVDLGIGNDTLYVEDSTDGDLNDGNDTGVANNRIAGGLGADTIVVTTAGRVDTPTEILDLSIYADANFSNVTGEHTIAELGAPAARTDLRGDEAGRAARVVTANFREEAYFANAALSGGPTDSDNVYVNDSNNVYTNLGNGDNDFIMSRLNGSGATDPFETVRADNQLNGAATAADAATGTSLVGNVTVEAGSGIDRVMIDTTGIKQVNTRGGDDIIDIGGFTAIAADGKPTFATGNVTVLSGTGNDSVVISSDSTAPVANAPANYIDLGSGDDTLTIMSKGVVNGVTEIYGRDGRDVVSIVYNDAATHAASPVTTDHTLYVELGSGADVMLMRARDLKNDDTISGANDGSIDTLILLSDGAATPRVDVSFSDTSRVEGFELIDLRGFGLATDAAATIDTLRTLPTTGINFTLTENLIARMDQTVTVGQVTQYVYGAALPADGAPQGTDGNNDGLFTAGVLGTMNTAATTGVMTVTTVQSGVFSDNNNDVNPHNAATLTHTLDLRALGDVLNSPTATLSADRSFVNFLGGMGRDVVVVDERSFNSFSNLRFDEFDFTANAFTATNRNVDEDNSSQDTLYVVANTSRNESTDISFGDYRNVQGLDVIALVDESTAVNSTFRLEASNFLVSQASSSLVAGIPNAAGNNADGVLVTLETGDKVDVYGANGQVLYSFTAGAAGGAAPTVVGNGVDLTTVDGIVDIIGVNANSFLIVKDGSVA